MSTKLSEKKLLAYDLAQKGLSQKEIGKIIQKSDRTVRNYLLEVREYLYNSKEWQNALEDLKNTIPDAVKVIRKYLKGKGSKPGGDLETAKWILEGLGIVHQKNDSEVSIENNSVTALNCDIKIDPQPDEEFAELVIPEIRKIAEFIDGRNHIEEE